MAAQRHSISIRATAADTWAVLRNFHDLGWAQNVVGECRNHDGRATDQIGTERLVGGLFRERLVGLDDHDLRLRYHIVEAPEPIAPPAVAGFLATIQVLPSTIDGTCVVDWKVEWREQSADPARTAFLEEIIGALLRALRDRLE